MSGILRSGLSIFVKDIAKGEEVFANPVYEIFIFREGELSFELRIPIWNFSHRRHSPLLMPCSEEAANVFM
jgi:hypothetical protein